VREEQVVATQIADGDRGRIAASFESGKQLRLDFY
jgi:hypothetical protein